MMMDLNDGRAVIRTEIESVVQEVATSNVRPLSKSMITEEIMSRWSDGVSGEYADIALVGLHDTVWNELGKRMNKDKKNEKYDPDPQIVMEGFERLQKMYVCDVDGDQTYVLTEEMSDEQLKDKAEEHRRFGRGNFQHADEIERYMEQRRESQTA